MESDWEQFIKKVVDLQGYLNLFKVDFLDRDGFKKFADELSSKVSGYTEVCITGYFSETIRSELEKVITYFQNRKYGSVRLICQELNVNSSRDKKNLQALQKMKTKGANIRVNNRLHARLLIAYTLSESKLLGGLLIIGSFDFNTECIGKERYDAGIVTKHPDLINSALSLFNQIWDESTPL